MNATLDNIEYETLGIKDQCISSSDLVAMMRKIAAGQGKQITIRTQDKPRWAKAVAKWTLILVAVVFGVGMLIGMVRP